MSSAINVTIGPGPSFSLVGLPDRIDDTNQPYIKLPPCPACGRTVDLDLIDVSTFGGAKTYLAGPWECPSGCDPRFRRFVIATDRRDFEHFCREHGWNPRRIVFVPTTGRGDQDVRGCRIHPGMIHITRHAVPDEELRAMILTRVERDARWHADMGNPFNINLIAIHHPPWVSRSIRLEGDRLPWSGVMVEAESPARDPESERWPDAYRWIPR